MTSSTSIPSNSEIDTENEPVRKAILAAMQRILLGQPRTLAPGAATFSDLAVEARVKRYHLYQKHPDLKDRFEYLRDQSARQTDLESQLQKRVDALNAQVAKLTDLQARTRAEARNWRAVSETFARAINVLQIELLRERTTSERLYTKVTKLEGLPRQEGIVTFRPRRDI